MQDSPPKTNEIELSFFGPGYGEGILIHVGSGKWIVVDSCIDDESGEPAALNYLSKLGIDPAEGVVLIVATHWHDDHVRGLSKIARICDSATVVISDALRTDDALTMIEAYAERPGTKNTPGVSEIHEVFNILKEKMKPPIWAVANRTIKRMQAGVSEAIVSALSPSDSALLQAKKALAQLLPRAIQPKRRLPDLRPNQTSVALWLEVNPIKILLGADLEETGLPDAGWSAIVNNGERPPGKASIYKIAHHGSENAHHSGIWSELLATDPWCIVTPMRNGKVFLPGPKEIRRICSQTKNAYCTSLPKVRKPNLGAIVTKTVSSKVTWLGPFNAKTGQVRFRLNPITEDRTGEFWTIELSEDARRLSDKVAQELEHALSR